MFLLPLRHLSWAVLTLFDLDLLSLRIAYLARFSLLGFSGVHYYIPHILLSTCIHSVNHLYPYSSILHAFEL